MPMRNVYAYNGLSSPEDPIFFFPANSFVHIA